MKTNEHFVHTYIISKNRNNKENNFYVRESTELYEHAKNDVRTNQENFNIIENTDKYKKSGIKIIKSIELEL